jgi:hypothetical protein
MNGSNVLSVMDGTIPLLVWVGLSKRRTINSFWGLCLEDIPLELGNPNNPWYIAFSAEKVRNDACLPFESCTLK